MVEAETSRLAVEGLSLCLVTFGDIKKLAFLWLSGLVMIANGYWYDRILLGLLADLSKTLSWRTAEEL